LLLFFKKEDLSFCFSPKEARSSFFEKKEAKKLFLLSLMRHPFCGLVLPPSALSALQNEPAAPG